MAEIRYKCMMCENTEYDIGELRGAGGTWTAAFDIESEKFTTITCTKCKHTTLYKEEHTKLAAWFTG